MVDESLANETGYEKGGLHDALSDLVKSPDDPCTAERGIGRIDELC